MKRFAYLLAAVVFASMPAQALDHDALFDKADQAYEAKDYEQALSWMTSLAVLGEARAQNYVGYMHAFAKGTIKDPEKAVTWYCHAALQGNAKAMFNIGRMFADGSAGGVDFETANWWYLQSAQLGNSAAQVNLGMNHLDGEGTEENPALSYQWLSIALQDFTGPKGLAHEYLADAERALSPSQLDEQKRAVEAWKPKGQVTELSAAKPCSSVDLDLKPLTFNKGSEALRHQEFDLAYALFKTLADDEHAPSQIILAEMFENGQGRNKDKAQATSWYCRAAGQGDQEALWRLASLHASDAEAFHTVGANLGDTRAQLVLGQGYMTKDPVQAYKWLSVASNENLDESGEAEELFDQVRAQVTREQKVEGITLAADFWPVKFSDEMAKTVRNSQTCRMP